MRLVGVVLCALAAAQGAQEPRARFRTGAERVTVDVLVTDGGRPVAGLDATAFELRDSGVPQVVSAVEMADVPISLMLALDTSNSVRGPLLRRLAEATQAAVELLRPDDRAALLTFNQAVVLSAAWGATAGELHDALLSAHGAGFTSLYDAMFAALVLRDARPGIRSVVIVFGDGVDTSSWLSDQIVAEKAKRTDAVVYTVRETASGQRASAFFTSIADLTGGEALTRPRGGSLTETFARIVTDFRSRYVLTYTPEGVDRPGWHPIDVRLKHGRRGTVTARRGYLR